MAVATSITVTGLPRSEASALRTRASRLGITPEEYLKRLIAEDTRMDRLAASKSFAELAEPFREALAEKSDEALDRLARPGKRRARR